MYEFEYFDGCDYTIFDIIETNEDSMKITVAVSYIGKVSIITYELYEDENGLYFEYGPLYDKIYTDDFIFRRNENDY